MVAPRSCPSGTLHRCPPPAAAAAAAGPGFPTISPRLLVVTAAVWAAAMQVAEIGVGAHSRIGCPTARSPSTNIKVGPCGSAGPSPANPLTTIAPGLLTVRIDESIRHVGAPFRISLSQDGTDDGACTLLDHIPANPQSRPSYSNEDSYTHYYITVAIPDVACERCSLQLANPMTDKIGRRGWQNCTYPANPGTDGASMPRYCFSVYHSCADIRITGRIPRADYSCPDNPPPLWPYRSPGHPPNIYPQMTGDWSTSAQQGSATGSWLLATSDGTAVNAAFRRGCGACAAPGMTTTGSCELTTPGPTATPSQGPTDAPTTTVPTQPGATFSPTRQPTITPSRHPTTLAPSLAPSPAPSAAPSRSPAIPSAAAAANSSDAILTGVGIAIGVLVVVGVAGVVLVLRRGDPQPDAAAVWDARFDNNATMGNPTSAAIAPRVLVLDNSAESSPALTSTQYAAAGFDF